MKKYTKIATAIVAGCALVGVTTGGAILLNDDDRDIIINVDTNPQEEPQEPEIPTEGDENPEVVGGEVTPELQEDENPTGEETPEEGDENPEDIPQDTPTEEEIPSEEVTPELQEDENPTDGYITVQVKIYNRNSGNLQSIEIIEYNNILGTAESVSNLVYWTELNYPKRREESSPNVISDESKNLNDYLTYSSDHEIDLIIYLI